MNKEKLLRSNQHGGERAVTTLADLVCPESDLAATTSGFCWYLVPHSLLGLLIELRQGQDL